MALTMYFWLVVSESVENGYILFDLWKNAGWETYAQPRQTSQRLADIPMVILSLFASSSQSFFFFLNYKVK